MTIDPEKTVILAFCDGVITEFHVPDGIQLFVVKQEEMKDPVAIMFHKPKAKAPEMPHANEIIDVLTEKGFKA